MKIEMPKNDASYYCELSRAFFPYWNEKSVSKLVTTANKAIEQRDALIEALIEAKGFIGARCNNNYEKELMLQNIVDILYTIKGEESK